MEYAPCPSSEKEVFLPVILSPQELLQIINSTRNLKHKAILSTIYSTGLRVSEAAHLKVSDIDSDNMRVFIRQAKGSKDRYSILSEKNLVLLREYWKLYHPVSWLFPGVPDSKPISARTIQFIFQDAFVTTGISKKASVHTLRHCFATHLLNNDAGILQMTQVLNSGDITSHRILKLLMHDLVDVVIQIGRMDY